MQESLKKFNKDLEEITVMNSTIMEIKIFLEGINCGINTAEEWMTELKNKVVEITSEDQQKDKRMKRIEDSLRDSIKI